MIELQDFKTLILTLVLLFLTCNTSALETMKPSFLAGNSLENQVRKFLTETAGTTEFQNIIDDSTFTSVELDSESLVKAMVTSLSEKFRNTDHAVQKLRRAAMNAYQFNQWTYGVNECCKFEFTNEVRFPSYDQRFGRDVDPRQTCSKIGGDKMNLTRAFTTMRRAPRSLISYAMENLHSTPGLKYQYYGSEEGIFTQYPARNTDSDCLSYDNRFRPWYVVAATPQPKDVVIVIDTSKTMKLENRMQGAKMAVSTVLETLNPNDKVAVIAYSHDVKLAPGPMSDSCFQDEMALATPENIRYLQDWIEGLLPKGGGYFEGGKYFEPPINKSFDCLERSFQETIDHGEPRRNQVILFMSDGEPSDDMNDLFQTIRVRNQKLHNLVVIMTYAIGAQAPGEVLEKMSKQDGSDYGVPKQISVREGLHVAITDSDDLRTKMGSYYNFFKEESIDTQVHWSVPYYDVGAGLIITASAAVVHEGTLRGVVGADISMRELLTEVTYFKVNSDLAYSFLVDRYFRAVAHPFLPAPSSVDNDPIIINITLLERSPALKNDLLPAIMNLQKSDNMNGRAATLEMSTMFVKEEEHGLVSEESRLARYSCQLIDGSPFTACVVLDAAHNIQSNLDFQEISEASHFQYHRLDIAPPEDLCLHLDRIVYHGSAVKFSPKAFERMESYLELEETSNNISSYKNLIENDIDDDEGLQISESAVNDVRLTGRIDEIWQNKSIFDSEISTLWRYVGTESGVFRIWPGVRLSQQYDPTTRPWYKTAMAHPDDNIITTPYTDASTGMWIITIAKAIMVYQGHDRQSHPYGVIASDVFLSDFKSNFLGHECLQEDCTLIDLSCHVIYHESYTWSHGSREIIGRHIVNVDPSLASAVFDQGLMKSEYCIDVNKMRIERSCRVNLEKLGKLSQEGFENLDFFAKIIEGTNTILLIKRSGVHYNCSKHNSMDDLCHYSTHSPYCESPCHLEAEFDHCNYSHSFEWGTDPPPCIAAKPKISVLPPVDLPTELSSCYDTLENLEPESNEVLQNDDPIDYYYEDLPERSNNFGIIFGAVTACSMLFLCCVKYITKTKNIVRIASTQQASVQPQQQQVFQQHSRVHQNYYQTQFAPQQFSVHPHATLGQTPPSVPPPPYNNAVLYSGDIHPPEFPPAPQYM